MPRRPDRDALYDAAQMWKEECLVDDGSVFGAGSVWTTEHLAALDEHFVQAPDTGGESFEAKLAKQLAKAGPGAARLAAEMLWVMMLMPVTDSITADNKRGLVRRVWARSGAELDPNHPMLGAPLEGGIAHPGAGLHSNRPKELAFFVRLVEAFKRFDHAERQALLGDPWRVSEWMSKIQGKSHPQMRHILLHLLFPDAIYPVINRPDRKEIIAAFAPELNSVQPQPNWSTDPRTTADQKVSTIHKVLSAQPHEGFLSFYVSPLRERWLDKQQTPPTPEHTSATPSEAAPVAAKVKEAAPAGHRVWAVGAGKGAVLWPEFLANGRIAISRGELGDLREYPTREAMHEAIKSLYSPEAEPLNDSKAGWQFCQEMKVGDEVFAKRGRDRVIGYGVVVGDYEFDDTVPEYKHVRRVRWISRGDWTLPARSRIPTKALTDISNYQAVLDYLRPLIDAGRIDTTEQPYSIDDAMQGVFMPREAFELIIESLKRRKNVVLQGAPGVGKSFLARRIAYAFIGHKRVDDVRVVQFHQSYSYEDFVQGWRPNEKGGFERHKGPFYEFCETARANSDRTFVFVIDEMNRGNLSKIFGELMLLIESDKRIPDYAVPLTYARSLLDTFYVPKNVYLLGLMNTADRSLAMVDHALRRRFAFHTLGPGFATPAFREALAEKGVSDVIIDLIVDRVGKLNAKITADRKSLGPGFEIGHSYFIPTANPVTDSGAWYDAVIEQEIGPLLREYWFENHAEVEKCTAIVRR